MASAERFQSRPRDPSQHRVVEKLIRLSLTGKHGPNSFGIIIVDHPILNNVINSHVEAPSAPWRQSDL
jgi:hypothetical protein